MLTKQEREEIAKRAQRVNGKKERDNPYFVLTGDLIPNNTPVEDDYKEMSLIINDLCDTSNMVELPRDKDGVPIHIGDTVWCDGDKCQVVSIRYDDIGLFGVEIYILSAAADMFRAFWRKPSEITHAEPVSDHESIARAIEDIIYHLDDAAASLKLQDIAMEIRELGGSND